MAAKVTPKAKPKSKKKVTTKVKVVVKKPVKAQRASLTKAKPKKAKAAPKKSVKPQRSLSTKVKPTKAKAGAKSPSKVQGATKVRSQAASTSKKAVKGKAKTVIHVTKMTKPITSAKKVEAVSIKTKVPVKEVRAKGKDKSASMDKAGKVPKAASGVAKSQKPVRVENGSASGGGTDANKASKSKALQSVGGDSAILDVSQLEDILSSATVAQSPESLLPDAIDAELDIEVAEGAEEVTLESLTADLVDDADDLKVEDLDDDFSEDSGDEADEDEDLTEDLSEELGPQKFFRDTEMNRNEDEDDPHSRSW